MSGHKRLRHGNDCVTTEEGIDRLIDRMDEAPEPIDELPEEPLDRIVRSMVADTRSRFQGGSLL